MTKLETVQKRRGPAWILAASALLAGCVHAPAAPDTTIALPTTWRGGDAVSTGDPSGTDQSWWSVFGDPELDALIRAALADNLTIEQAIARLDGARALVVPARAQGLPQISATASGRLERRLTQVPRTAATRLAEDAGFALPPQDRTTGVYQVGFDASWEPDLFARARNGVRAARASAGIAEADLRAIRVSVAAEVARAYLELRSAQDRRGLLTQIERSQQQTLAVLRDRRAVGLASDFDVDRAEAALADTRALIPREAAEIGQTGQRLALLLGMATPPALAMKPPPSVRSSAFTPMPADLLRTRPEIASAEQAVLQAAAEAGLARADLYPRLTLGGAVTLSGDVTGASLGGRSGVLGGGPSVTLPLFDWSARRAVVGAREAALAAAAAAYRQAVLEAVTEVETALFALKSERDRTAQLSVSVAAAQRAADNSGRLLSQGLIDVSDRLAAEVAARQAQLSLSESRLGEALSVIALHKALGGGMPVETEDNPGPPE